jgi:hypothetical protein
MEALYARKCCALFSTLVVRAIAPLAVPLTIPLIQYPDKIAKAQAGKVPHGIVPNAPLIASAALVLSRRIATLVADYSKPDSKHLALNDRYRFLQTCSEHLQRMTSSRPDCQNLTLLCL